jgi:hypothetical protein
MLSRARTLMRWRKVHGRYSLMGLFVHKDRVLVALLFLLMVLSTKFLFG